MSEYHKIQTMFKRDEKTHRIIEGDWTCSGFGYLKDNTWVFTEKVDGTNIRVKWNGKEVSFGGKTDDAQIAVYLYDKLEKIFRTPEQIEAFRNTFGEKEAVLYGEGYGAKIQKGGGNYNPKGVDFVLFDSVVDGWWLERPNVEDIASRFGIASVPIVGEGTLQDAIDMVRKGMQSQWGNFIAEGIVARPKAEIFSRKGERIITKIKHKDFK